MSAFDPKQTLGFSLYQCTVLSWYDTVSRVGGDMRRRHFLGVLSGAALWPYAARSQAPTVPVVGFLSPHTGSVDYVEGFFVGLRELGYVDGRNIRIESRWASGKLDQLAQLAAELVGLDVNVLVTSVTEASLQAKKATARIPIVMVAVGDPVAVGLVASLARPSGNVTGTSSLSIDIVGKQIELLTAVAPGISRVALLWNPDNSAYQALQLQQAEQAARVAGLELQLVEARSAGEIATAFGGIKKGTQALAVLGDSVLVQHAKTIAELALKNRLITAGLNRGWARAGILLTYGPSFFDLHKRAATYVDKILKGAVPADLPVEQPTKFELLVNLKTAKALGLVVPPSLLARADEVIE
jgi:putative tryptophan/tyrosine transport system substrate-binding protein